MKDFHRSFICRSTDTGKKGHRSKHLSNKNEVCKCYAPFLKLHYYDCPVAKKPCPIHGNAYRPYVKDEKAEKKENMIISFHPSLKTDRLFKPVKNLLAHCSSETKINVEYYSPNNSNFKNNIKHCQVQTSPKELKKNLGDNIIVEKTKSFVTDKTNRMKRLKQCFYSPCNSIVARTRSQITIKDKINENFHKIAKDIAVATNISEEPPENVYFDEKFKWPSSNKWDSSDWEKSSNDKMESDFVTVTKQMQDKIIDHKIFEIKHKKGLGDFRYTKPPKETPLVYSTYEIGKSKSSYNVENGPLTEQKNLEKYSKNNELVGKNKNKEEETNSSDKSQSSSSGSVYFTPFILIPPGIDESSSEGSKYSDYTGKMNKGKLVNAYAQTENSPEKVIYEASSTSENSSLSKSSEFYKETIPLKEEKNLDAEGKSPSMEYLFAPEEPPSRTTKTSGKKNSDALRNSLQNTDKSLDKSTQITPTNSRFTNEYELFKDKTYDTKIKPTPEDFLSVEKTEGFGDKKYNSMQIQTDAIQKREVALVYDGIKKLTNAITQTDQVLTKNVQVETMAPKKNKSQMTHWTTARSVQTSFTLSDSTSQSNEQNFKDIDGNVNFVVTSCIAPDSCQDINKSRWKKSRSEGDLYSGPTDNSASDNVIPLRHVCLCENSETSTSESELIACEKICKSDKSISEKSNMKPIIHYQNEQRPTAMKKDVISKGEQTSLSDLTELLKMVDQLFNKMSKEAFKSCDCEKIKQKESRICPEVITDSSKSVKKPKTVDAEVQTMFKMVTNVSEEEKGKESLSQGTRRNAVGQNTGETVFICKICRKKVSTVVAGTCTTLDSVEKSSSSKKEVTFTSAGTTTDGLEKSVLCKSIGVCVSDYNVIDCCVPAQTQSVNEIKRTFTCDSNDQTPNEWTINIISRKCSAFFEPCSPKEESKFGSNKSQVKKETTTNQVSEKKVIKKTQGVEAWKSPEYSLLSESHSISKTSDFCKPRPAPGKDKSNIPTPSSNLRKPTDYKYKETGKTNTNTQAPITQGVSKEVLKSERDPCSPVLSFNRNTVCFCEPPKPSPKIEPSTSGRNPKCTDQKPPLPTKQPPGACSPKTKTNPSQIPSPTPKKPGQKKTMVYPAIIRPILYTDFRKAWQIMKNFQSHDSNSRVLKQKRYCEKEYPSPGGKKIKRKDNGSGENSKFENNIFTAHGQKTIDMRNTSGFVWTPSSTLQIPKTESRPKCFYKGSQSESNVPQNLPLFKGFNKRPPANAMSVTSCRLKPVQVNEKHPFKKLFECRLCKSLNFLKNDQKDILQNEKPSDGAFGFESVNAKDESPVSDDESPEPLSWVFSPEIKDNFFLECSLSSDFSDSTNLSKNSDSFSDGCEAKSESVGPNFFNPSARASSISNTADASRSFQTFWFGSERKK